MNSVFFCLEILGIIAFSVSGALVAIKSKFDVFGVVVVGVITAVGGGILRDVLLNQAYPTIFDKKYLLCIASVSALLTFILAFVKRKHFSVIEERIELVNNYFDALGLAVFTVTGVETTLGYGFTGNGLIVITMGVLTGVGGGLMRDLFTGEKISIFTKHIYAIASILGAVLFYSLRSIVEITAVATVVGVLGVFLLRLVANKYHWELPKAHIEEEQSCLENKENTL